jgi:hypothetical protein
MPHLARPWPLQTAVLIIFLAGVVPAAAEDLPSPVCDLVIHEELAELEEARIAVSLAHSNFAAYERIFEMIESLWEAKAIPRMTFVEARYDRDAAKLALDAADLILERQAALVEQYRLICDAADSGSRDRSGAIRDAYLRYRRADCDSLAKTIEVAATNLEFNQEFLSSILHLREESVATKTDVILAELDVEREEKSLADARRRTAACREELAGLEETATSAPSPRSSM